MGRHSGLSSRESKKSVLFYTTDCADDPEDDLSKLQQRSVSLTALHTGSQHSGQQQQLLEPRMAQLETLEAKMASIEVSLSTTPRRKKGGSVSGGMTSPAGHRNRDHYKELDALKVALRDKENIIQTLKGQLCNTLSNRLALRNGAPPLTEADREATEERLQRLRRDADNKRLAIKNLKLALERLDITDNIDVRIQQAELEYRLGREELELLTLREESRALQAALELAETQEKQKNDTIFSCISGIQQVTIHAVEVSADPKSPRFGAGPRDDVAGLYVDWAVEDSGLCKGDRILEVNGKLVVGASRNDLARLLAVAPDAAQIVVLRNGESLAALRTLRSDNLRLTHRIGYLEEQVRDLLTPQRTDMIASPLSPLADLSPRGDGVQVFQKGPQVTALVSNLPGLHPKTNISEFRQSLPSVRTSTRHSNGTDPPSSHHHRRFTESRSISKDLDFCSDSMSSNGHHKSSRNKQKASSQGMQSARSTASLDLKEMQQQSPRRRSSRMELDSEPTYYRMQDPQSRITQDSKNRVAPPKKPLRLSLHRAASLQSMESVPVTPTQDQPPRKPTKRNHRGDPPPPTNDKYSDKQRTDDNRSVDRGCSDVCQSDSDRTAGPPPQPPPRTPSRAESCQSALRWPSPKPRPHFTAMNMEKWC